MLLRIRRLPQRLRTFFSLLAEDQIVLSAAGITLDHALQRGSQLFGAPLVRFIPLPAQFSTATARRFLAAPPGRNQYRVYYSAELHPDRDHLLLSASDQTRMLAVRRGGNLHQLLRCRGQISSCAETGVILTLVDERLVASGIRQELRDLGCQDWWICPTDDASDPAPGDRRPELAPVIPLKQLDGTDFLSHWTRALHRHWPDRNSLTQWDMAFLRNQNYRGPAATLCRILAQQVLLASGKLIRGGRPMCCFTAVPPGEFPRRRVFRPHLARWDFERYGIAIRRTVLERFGARPVRYVTAGDAARASPGRQPWLVIENAGTRWSDEREWRVAGHLDLRKLAPDEAVVFAGDPDSAEVVRQFSRWPVTILPPAEPACGPPARPGARKREGHPSS